MQTVTNEDGETRIKNNIGTRPADGKNMNTISLKLSEAKRGDGIHTYV
jgi:hypothetical protein